MSTKSGDALVAEAIKLRDGWSLFGSKKDRQRDAAAIFIKAAIAFKLEQSCKYYSFDAWSSLTLI